jgi:membrane protein implicated in regulation of membrane protease activity
MFAARPALRKRLESGLSDHAPLHTRGLVGRGAVAVSRVDGQGGQVRIGGELWSARALDDHDVIEEGTAVTVMQISGATALVVTAG